MIRWMVAAAGLLLAACTAPKADALGWLGNQDNFDVVQTIVVPPELKPFAPEDWKNGVDLVRHSQTLFIGAGVWVTDKGYAIRVHGSRKYLQINEKNLATFQAVGVLPKVMPTAGIPLTTYLIGYSLWIVLGVFGIIFALSPSARQRFVQNLSNQPINNPAPDLQAGAPAVAPAWQSRAMMSVDQAKASAAQPAPPMRKVAPLKSPNPPMVEGPRSFGRKR